MSEAVEVGHLELIACQERRQRLRGDMTRAGIEALLVSHPTDIRYLTEFVGDDSYLIVSAADGDAVIISDARYDEFLEPWRTCAEVVIGIRHRLPQSVREVCDRRRLRKLGIQSERVTVAGRRALTLALGREVTDTEGLVGRLRMRKDEVEIRAIERAISIHQEALPPALDRLAPGMTELELCAAIEYEMKIRGASGPSFATMVASGPRSSVIHYTTSSKPIGPGVLLIDWGAVVDGYCSDMTRTFAVGRMPKKIAEMYRVVAEAQQAAIQAMAPGRTCAEMDGVARRIIEAAGYGAHFTHGLGHGVGLNIHEEPFFNAQSAHVLEPGMVMTVEPGIYLPGVGGVRIEDDVLITERGCRVLTSFPKDPGSAVLEPAAAGGAA